MVFCTLFDSFYMDKGVALYRSLEKVTNDFKLYIYAFDDKAYHVLNEMELTHAIIIHKRELEVAYPILESLKATRSKAEYCWTCTPISIEYVLNYYKEENCTYIDSDLYFFANPNILEHEIKKCDAKVVITPHRFTNSLKDRRLEKRSGTYCVEFNYFDQSKSAREVLTWWKERCFEWCYHLYEPERMGDQKYLMKFESLFSGVHVLEHLGGGVAPWNLKQYEFVGMDEEKIPVLRERKTGIEFPVVFYHFQSMRYLSENTIIIRSETHSKRTKDALYRPYLGELEIIRSELRHYGITFPVVQSYASNPVIAFLQRYVLRYKVKSFSDIYDLNQIRREMRIDE